jgi:indolepyruvate ferredoxin oxidoreductase beta subunit
MIEKNKKSWRIVLAGTGGQGVITAARLLTDFFLLRGEQVLSGQLHGMAQRGGAVQSTVMINCGISPAIPKGSADVVVGLEPVETARALDYISEKTTVFMNERPVVPFVLSQNHVLEEGITRYPDVELLVESIRKVTSRLHTLDATALAEKAGAFKALNTVMLGCLMGAELLPCTAEEFRAEMIMTLPEKFLEKNSKAFSLGVEFMKKNEGAEETA